MPKWHQEKLFPTHSSSWLVLSPVPSANSINFKAHHCELGVKATMLLRKSKVLQAALLIRDPWRPKVCKVPQPFIVREGLLGLTEMAPSHPSSKRSLSVNYWNCTQKQKHGCRWTAMPHFNETNVTSWSPASSAGPPDIDMHTCLLYKLFDLQLSSTKIQARWLVPNHGKLLDPSRWICDDCAPSSFSRFEGAIGVNNGGHVAVHSNHPGFQGINQKFNHVTHFMGSCGNVCTHRPLRGMSCRLQCMPH